MGLKNLIVHLDSGATTSERLAIAASLAAAHGARLVGVFAQRAKAHHIGFVSSWPSEDYVAAAEASSIAFAAAAKGLAASEWIDLHRAEEAEINAQMRDLTRHFDLVVCGQPNPEDGELTPPDMIERIVVDAGRPVLAIPYAGHFPSVGRRPLFAWSDAREAARALCDAIPLAQPGAQGLVVSIVRPKDKDRAEYLKTSLAFCVAHLAAHGIEARADQAMVSEIGVMDALLNRAGDHGADLLAIGAFGGQGYPRFSRGSGSRFLMKHMTLPVLFSH